MKGAGDGHPADWVACVVNAVSCGAGGFFLMVAFEVKWSFGAEP